MEYNYKKTNAKKTLVFIHGFLGTKAIWDELQKEFLNKYSILTVNLPGHGDNQIVEHTTINDLAQATLVLLEKLKIKSCILVGHSMGGYICGEILREKASVVEAIILINSSLLADTDEKKKERLKAINAVNKNIPLFAKSLINGLFLPTNVNAFSKEIDLIQKKIQNINAQTVIAYLYAMRNRKPTIDIAKKTAIPMLYLASKKDKTIPYANILKQLKGMKKTKLIPLENSGHMSFIEEKEVVNTAIKSFLLSF